MVILNLLTSMFAVLNSNSKCHDRVLYSLSGFRRTQPSKGMENFFDISPAYKHLINRTKKLNDQKIQRENWSSSKSSVSSKVSWSWTTKLIIELLLSYPTGITKSILFSELENQWDEVSKDFDWRNSNKSRKLIQSVLDEGSISQFDSFEAVISDVRKVSESTYLLSLMDNKDTDSGRGCMDMYLHTKYQNFATGKYERFLQKRILRFTNVRLVDGINNEPNRKRSRSSNFRFLPCVQSIVVLDSESPEVRQFVALEIKDTLLTISNSAGWRDFAIKIKVIGIKIRVDEKERRRYAIVYVQDDSIQTNFQLMMVDDHSYASELFKVNDTLVIIRPTAYDLKANRLGVDDMTIIFCLTNVKNEAGFQSNVAGAKSMNESENPNLESYRDEDGSINCKSFPDRIYTTDLRPSMTHFSLFGTVIGTGCSPKVNEDGTQSFRFGFTLSDERGTANITLWEELGVASSSVQIGQVLFLENLHTTGLRNGKFFVMGAKSRNTQVHNVSCLRGLLSSPWFSPSVSLYEIRAQLEKIFDYEMKENQRSSRVQIQKVHISHSDQQCGRSLGILQEGIEDKNLECGFCKEIVKSPVFDYNAKFMLDDGTSFLENVSILPSVAKVLIRLQWLHNIF
ncbi:hypothetical protein HK098_002917 [Nowakowskiella sp. JEL0407]|nr:hypothetical protein HK098_002917 [Nowakowskiella sp. JEL0407]